jgi:hypothetical protein
MISNVAKIKYLTIIIISLSNFNLTPGRKKLYNEDYMRRYVPGAFIFI